MCMVWGREPASFFPRQDNPLFQHRLWNNTFIGMGSSVLAQSRPGCRWGCSSVLGCQPLVPLFTPARSWLHLSKPHPPLFLGIILAVLGSLLFHIHLSTNLPSCTKNKQKPLLGILLELHWPKIDQFGKNWHLCTIVFLSKNMTYFSIYLGHLSYLSNRSYSCLHEEHMQHF